MALTDKVRIRNHRRVDSQLEANLPQKAFAGATLDILYAGEGLANVDDATRDRLVNFAEDFLACDCEGAPHCGCPERKFLRTVLELREQGMGPHDVVDVIGDEYLLTAYPGDVRSFLDDGIRTLEALADLAEVDGRDAVASEARKRRDALE